MATAAVTFIQSNVVPRQPNLRVRGRTSCIVYCNNGSRETGDGQQNEAVDMAKLLGLVLQTDESKALLKDLDEAVQRVENAKRELKELDQQRPEEKMASKFDQEMESQQRLIDECERELAAAKAEADAAQVAMDSVRAEVEGKWKSSDVNEEVERVESGKAALVSATAGVAASLPFVLAESGNVTAGTVFSAAIAFVSCAVFGVTYRYVLRKDIGNTQLKAGCAAAFALARGLGQADVLVGEWEQVSVNALACIGQSFLLFFSAAVAIDLGFCSNVLKPFSYGNGDEQ